MSITTVQFYSNTSGQNKLIFGIPQFEILNSDKYNYLAGFIPNSIFCVLNTKHNTFGTRRYRLLILKALNDYEEGRVINFIKPGAEVLLEETGKKHVDIVLKWLDDHHMDNAQLASLPPEHYQGAGNRFTVGMKPRKFTNKKSNILERIAG